MRTKAEILTAKRDYLAHALDMAQREIDGLKGTDCGLSCGGCGKVLETEWDFASHYLVADERYTNLGGCPERPYNPATGPRISVHFEVTTKMGN